MRIWVVLMLLTMGCEGPMGPEGPQGPQGPAGVQGPQGNEGMSGSGLVSVIHCAGSMPLPTESFELNHDAYIFADGSVLASCYVWATEGQRSGTAMFTSSQVGAARAACSIGFDFDTASFGYLTFALNGVRSYSTVTYHDAGRQYDGRTSSLSCSAY